MAESKIRLSQSPLKSVAGRSQWLAAARSSSSSSSCAGPSSCSWYTCTSSRASAKFKPTYTYMYKCIHGYIASGINCSRSWQISTMSVCCQNATLVNLLKYNKILICCRISRLIQQFSMPYMGVLLQSLFWCHTLERELIIIPVYPQSGGQGHLKICRLHFLSGTNCQILFW